MTYMQREAEADAAILIESNALPFTGAHTHWRAADFLALCKPRVVVMVLLTTVAGYYLAAPAAPLDYLRLLATLAGTALAAGGTLALNQLMERDLDARMQRTCTRPLPDGRLAPRDALVFGALLTAGGVIYLALAVALQAAVVTAATTATYLFAYTPLKPRTALCSVVGAVSGALPPVIGWAAARGTLDAGAWALFAILFLWQIPHAFAIARLYRDDYARAGFRLLPVIEPDWARTGRQIVSSSLALVVIGLVPTLIGLAGIVYCFVSLALGCALLAASVQLARSATPRDARRLLLTSLIYLPLLLATLAANKMAFSPW
jgi:protoheme IX farnesyltransferase